MARSIPFLWGFCVVCASIPHGEILNEGSGSSAAHPRILTYVNSLERPESLRKFESLDAFTALVARNVEENRYMRDSMGLSQSTLTLEFATPEEMDAEARDIYRLLDHFKMKYSPNEYRTNDGSHIREISLFVGRIPKANTYFDLRDSLFLKKSSTIRVAVQEVPYTDEYRVNWDSVQWFLQTLSKAPIPEKAAFTHFLFTRLAKDHSMLFYSIPRGIQLDIQMRVPILARQSHDRSEYSGGKGYCGVGLRLFRNDPVVVRAGKWEMLFWLSVLFSFSAFLLSSILIWKMWRQKKRAKKTAESV